MARRRAAAAGTDRGTGRRAPGARRPSTPAPARTPELPANAVLALVLLGAVILHGSALTVPFFADDYLFLEAARGRGLIAALMTPDPIGNFFRPVGRQLFFWLIGHLSGESPIAFHVVNLALFLGIVALMFVVARRLAGLTAAALASGFIALHYAADVPIRWVSGSQELLSVLGALGAMALFLGGRRLLAAPVLLLALLAKESVVLTPVIAMLAAREPAEPWRRTITRAWPLGAAVAAWAALWLVTLPARQGMGGSLGIEPWGWAAVLAHLVHVSLGLEWRGAFEAVGRAVPPVLALLPVLVALAMTGRGRRERGDRHLYLVAAVWAVAATVPLLVVAAIWSAYYYLFALCGVALAVGVLGARMPRWGALVLLAALATGSASGRASSEFATGRGAWTAQSRINRFYIDRATVRIARYLAGLKKARPTVPHRSSFFYGGVPAFVAWQTGDGPIVRWAYRDTSLRSYYQSDFTLERGHRGPAFFFTIYNDSLVEAVRRPGELRGIAMNVLMNDKIDTCHDVLSFLMELEPPATDVEYFLAWIKMVRGDAIGGREMLKRAGLSLDAGPTPEIRTAGDRLAAGDTVAAATLLGTGIMHHALDPNVHATFCELLLNHDPDDSQARVEGLALRALAPNDARTWVRWGLIQAHDNRHSYAVTSLERALALGGLPEASRTQVNQVIHELRRAMPGGDLVQQGLKIGPGERPEERPNRR